jgi:hypothetical protein
MAVHDSFVRPVLFGIDAERVHGWATATAGLASSAGLLLGPLANAVGADA